MTKRVALLRDFKYLFRLLRDDGLELRRDSFRDVHFFCQGVRLFARGADFVQPTTPVRPSSRENRARARAMPTTRAIVEVRP